MASWRMWSVIGWAQTATASPAKGLNRRTSWAEPTPTCSFIPFSRGSSLHSRVRALWHRRVAAGVIGLGCALALGSGGVAIAIFHRRAQERSRGASRAAQGLPASSTTTPGSGVVGGNGWSLGTSVDLEEQPVRKAKRARPERRVPKEAQAQPDPAGRPVRPDLLDRGGPR